MATEYSKLEIAIPEVAARIDKNRIRLDGAKAALAATELDLADMPGIYGTMFADLDAAALATPGNTGLVTMKARKDLLVAEFTALNTRATALKAAVQGL